MSKRRMRDITPPSEDPTYEDLFGSASSDTETSHEQTEPTIGTTDLTAPSDPPSTGVPGLPPDHPAHCDPELKYWTNTGPMEDVV